MALKGLSLQMFEEMWISGVVKRQHELKFDRRKTWRQGGGGRVDNSNRITEVFDDIVSIQYSLSYTKGKISWKRL